MALLAAGTLGHPVAHENRTSPLRATGNWAARFEAALFHRGRKA
jgi:hypothetical protein